MKLLKTAVIGLQFGMAHIEGAIHCGAEIAAICDGNADHLRFAGERYGIAEERRFTDHRALLARDDIDAVVIAVPDQRHRALTNAFLEAGKHVLCEKPMALTREDTQAMIRAAERGVKLFISSSACQG